MREILFRGKRIDNGEWIEGSLLVLDADSGDYFITEPYESASTLSVRDLIYNCTHLVDPETVCQYTGVKDRNGVKIFEGDIIRHFNMWKLGVKAYYERAVILWEGKDSRWNNHCLKDEGNYQLDGSGGSVYEVIGNIFDNPELMKGAE